MAASGESLAIRAGFAGQNWGVALLKASLARFAGSLGGGGEVVEVREPA